MGRRSSIHLPMPVPGLKLLSWFDMVVILSRS
jgi:hypothetical protein